MDRSVPNLVPFDSSAPPDTRLHGWRLAVARVLVFTTMTLIIGLFALALPGFVSRLATPCVDAPNTCLIAPPQVAPLATLGVTPYALALAVVVLSGLTMLLASGVAAVLVWRRSDDWMALLVALTLTLMPLEFTPVLWGLTGVWKTPAQVAQGAGIIAPLLLIMLFPSGRFVPRWLWLPVLGVALVVALAGPSLSPVISLFLVLGTVLSLIASQIYRYRRVSTSVQRQQTKWAVYGLVLTLLVNQLFWQSYGGIPALNQPDSLYSLLAVPDDVLLICILVVFFGVSILRSRLFDIDVIIRRTLVYGILTVVLATLYAGIVIGLQALVGVVSSAASQSSVLIVASTLLIAALFTPLRRRIQAVIDRSFYRRKYDAAKTVASFGDTLRNEVDLSHLHAHLVTVVQETMQPTHVSLWLAPSRQVLTRQLAEPPLRRKA